MKRLDQIVLSGTFIGFSWLVMQAVHELGHVLGALSSGGTVNCVVLYPTTISRTDVYPNPHHLWEVWAGCIVGALLPFIFFLVAARCKSPGLYLFRFFAGFCLIANGLYIGSGSFYALADAEELLLFGAQKWHLLAFGVLTMPVGLYLWHGLGPAFGFGEADGKVSRAGALTSLGLFAAIVGIEMVIGSK